jgi:hypothetical protein
MARSRQADLIRKLREEVEALKARIAVLETRQVIVMATVVLPAPPDPNPWQLRPPAQPIQPWAPVPITLTAPVIQSGPPVTVANSIN